MCLVAVLAMASPAGAQSTRSASTGASAGASNQSYDRKLVPVVQEIGAERRVAVGEIADRGSKERAASVPDSEPASPAGSPDMLSTDSVTAQSVDGVSDSSGNFLRVQTVAGSTSGMYASCSYPSPGFYPGVEYVPCAYVEVWDGVDGPTVSSQNWKVDKTYDACGALIWSDTTDQWRSSQSTSTFSTGWIGGVLGVIPSSACPGTWTLVTTFTQQYTNGATLTDSSTVTFPVYASEAAASLSAQTEPTGGPVSAVEALGGCAPCSYQSRAHATAYPVDTLSGSFWHTFDDLAIPGRGPALELSRSYNSSQASVDGLFGYGWSSTYGMALDVNGSTATVHQETGAVVTFGFDGSAWTAPPRMFASLTDNGDGTWTFVRRSKDSFTFDSLGRLIAIEDLNGYTTAVSYPDATTKVVTGPAGRSFTFTLSGGRVTAVTDSSTPARTISYTYDPAGDLVEVVDEGGGHWQFTYDGSHRMLTMRSPRFYGDTTTTPSPVVTNHYDIDGRVDWQSDPLGRTTSFDYTTEPGSTLVTNPKGDTTAFEYAHGLLVSVTRGYGAQPATWHYRYDPDTLGRTTTVDPNGNVTTATYDSAGNLLSATDALGHTTEFTYNSLRQVTSITEPQQINGQPVIRTMTYDTAGNPLTESAPLLDPAGVTVATATTTYHYDDPTHPGDVTGVTDPNGNATSYTYDAVGNLVSVTAPPTTENPAGNTTTYTYTDRGWLSSATAPRGNLTGATPADFTASYDHDAYGRTTLVTDALGNQTTTTYDADGNVEMVTDDNSHTTTFVHNAAGELIETIRPDSSVVRTDYWPDGAIHRQYDPANQPTTYTYDPLGQLATTTDPLNRITKTSYDRAGNLVSVIDPSNRTTTYSYDAANQLIGIDYSDTGTPDVTAIAYDDNGRRTSMTAGAGTSTWTWDSLGRLTSHTDANGKTISYGYDIGDRQTSVTYPGTTGTVTRSYDAANRLTAIEDWNQQLTTFAYDADSNIINRSYPNGTSTTATVDHASRLMAISHAPSASPASPFVSFGYSRDGVGQLTSVTSTGVPSDNHNFGYTALDQIQSVDTDNFGYDSADNLVTRLDGTAQSFDAAHQLDAAGPTINRVGTSGAGNDTGKTLTVAVPAGVTGDDQLLLAVTLANSKSVATPAGYSIVGTYASGGGGQAAKMVLFRRTATGAETNVSLEFSHSTPKSATLTAYRGVSPTAPIAASTSSGGQSNAVSVPSLAATPGQQLVAFTGAAGVSGTWSTQTGMTLLDQHAGGTTDAAVFDQPVTTNGATGSRTFFHSAITHLVGTLVALNPAGSAYGYDPQGNRVSYTSPTGAPVTLGYDQANRLTSYDGIATYGYNGDGLRTTKTIAGVTSAFTWDSSGELPLLLVDGDTNYIYGPGGLPLARIDSTGETLYYHQDQLGSTRALTDSTGAVVATYTYDPFGNVTGSTGAADNPFGYTGQYTDPESGYQYLRARYYDPLTGQFLTRDPAVATTMEPYAYAGNNPTNYTDPTGLYWGEGIVNKAKDTASGAWDATGGKVVSGVNDLCFESWQEAATCTAVVAGTVSLGVGGAAVLGVGGGLAGTAGTVASTAGYIGVGAQGLLTVDDCRRGVDGSCLINGAATLAGGIGLGLGSAAGNYGMIGAHLRDADIYAGIAQALGVGGLTAGAVGYLFGFPGVASFADC